MLLAVVTVPAAGYFLLSGAFRAQRTDLVTHTVRAERLELSIVERGALRSYLLDSYSGRKLALGSTHHAVRDGAGVTVGTTNLMLLPGTTPAADLIASVRDGLYVTELIGFGVNGVTGDYSRGAAGIWIENGRLAYPVEEVTVAGNLLDMFAAIDGVGDDLVLRERTASPTLRIARMVVAGH